ncbi:PREDICTED: WEB family protein At5g16730, chloroplastic-like [Camelina sativa]|uniref:WEB family protein At5g16730, chloroplastic-like n=1 Tax=Camelina sativa TaxID=90675 RepID=A0ABM0U7I8_CAMSA|nr:PREDICTED: WEB family protein At5g16730, chloroplastic-like [Camelina sativa]
MGEVDEKPSSIDVASPRYYSSTKVADIDTELFKMKASLENEVVSLKAELLKKDTLMKNLEAEVEKSKELEKQLLDSFEEKSRELEETKALVEESKVEIASLKERIDTSYNSQDSSEDEDEDDSSVQDFDIESIKIEMESTKESLAKAHESAEASSLRVSDLLEEMKSVKNELQSATDAEMTSKKAMDDLALALKEVATDCSQAKEKLVTAETELEASRLESQQWKEKHDEVRKEAELLKNTSERLRIEAEESLLAWNGKESVFVSCIKRGEDEKNSLLDENNRLLEALVAAENLSKKAKDENHKVRDILKQAINEANVAKEAAGIARAENSNLKDALLDKEDELEFALKEIERVKVNEALANDNVKKLKKLLSEIEVAMEEEKHRSLSRQESLHKDVEVVVEKKIEEKEKKEEKKENKKEKKESKKEKKEHSEKKEEKEKKEQTHQNIDKKMIGKTCSFSIMKLGHHNYNHSKHNKETALVEEEITKASNGGNHQQENSDGSGEGSSPSSDSYLFKGSIFDVAETPHAQTHHKRRSSCTFLEEVETMNPEDLENLDGNHLEEGELNDKGAVARKKKAFIRRFGDLLVRRKSLSFSHKKESSTDSQDKQQQPQTPPSPSPPLLPPMSPEP